MSHSPLPIQRSAMNLHDVYIRLNLLTGRQCQIDFKRRDIVLVLQISVDKRSDRNFVGPLSRKPIIGYSAEASSDDAKSDADEDGQGGMAEVVTHGVVIRTGA